MDVRIGVIQTAKEIELDLDDGTSRDDLRKQIESAVGDENSVLWLTDRRGRSVAVPAGKVAYIEIGSSSDGRRVGFGAP